MAAPKVGRYNFAKFKMQAEAAQNSLLWNRFLPSSDFFELLPSFVRSTLRLPHRLIGYVGHWISIASRVHFPIEIRSLDPLRATVKTHLFLNGDFFGEI